MEPPVEIPMQPHSPEEEPKLPPFHACGGLLGKYDASDLQSPTTSSATSPPPLSGSDCPIPTDQPRQPTKEKGPKRRQDRMSALLNRHVFKPETASEIERMAPVEPDRGSVGGRLAAAGEEARRGGPTDTGAEGPSEDRGEGAGGNAAHDALGAARDQPDVRDRPSTTDVATEPATEPLNLPSPAPPANSRGRWTNRRGSGERSQHEGRGVRQCTDPRRDQDAQRRAGARGQRKSWQNSKDVLSNDLRSRGRGAALRGGAGGSGADSRAKHEGASTLEIGGARTPRKTWLTLRSWSPTPS
jgi:hypothetical protein